MARGGVVAEMGRATLHDAIAPDSGSTNQGQESVQSEAIVDCPW